MLCTPWRRIEPLRNLALDQECERGHPAGGPSFVVLDCRTRPTGRALAIPCAPSRCLVTVRSLRTSAAEYWYLESVSFFSTLRWGSSTLRFGGTLFVLALVWAGTSASQAWSDSPGASTTGTHVPLGTDPVLDSARAEFDAGRYWHASRLLRSRRDAGDGVDHSEILLLARADAGWKNWSAVVEDLEGEDWLDELEGAEGRRLLARGLEAAERWDAATESFARFRATDSNSGVLAPEASREARTAARAGRWGSIEEAMEMAGRASPKLVAWTALDVAEWLSDNGDASHVLELLQWIRRDSTAAAAAWDIEARTLLGAGDSSGALKAYLLTLETETRASRRGRAFSTVGRLRLARADSAGARQALLASLAAYPRGASGARAASALIDMNDLDADPALLAAQTLDRARDGRRALVAYRRYEELRPDSVASDPAVRLIMARLLSATGEHEAAIREFRLLVETDDPEFELRVLDQWLRTRRRQGRRDASRTIQGWIIERFPESRQAVDIVFAWAAAAQDRGAHAEALAGFERAMIMAPSLNSAGHARMRLGQMHLLQDDVAAAAGVFEGYVSDFPNGQRWEQAAYWAARSLEALGKDSEAEGYLDMIQKGSPISYYGALVSERLEEPYAPEVLEGPASDPPAWLLAGLSTLDLLTTAGLDDAEESQVAHLIAQADGSVAASLDVADNLIERGFTIDGINVGWKLLRDGSPYTRRLLRVLYPFPYREIVTREAVEAGIEPLFLASLIRQESAFAPGIRSPAGAIGLMQVMPETGRELARGQGIRGFTPESLETAEINLHLGTTFWVDMERRYGDGNLPLALSAYNAGPTRARRWGRLPEAQDPLRFTERIPFDETRGYVKNITRNLHLYRFLYGQD